MNLLIAGSRNYSEAKFKNIMHSLPQIVSFTEPLLFVVSGMARGPDSYGANWASDKGVMVMMFPADWEKHGKKAGMIRNAEMAEFSDFGLIFWDGLSKGTGAMIKMMEKKHKQFIIF